MQRREKLGTQAKLSATVLAAYLAWAQKQWPDALERLQGELTPERLALIRSAPEEAEWVGFADAMEVVRAIARVAGGDPNATFHALGSHSAAINLAGACKSFTPEEPHRFFDSMGFLHGSFQNFGRSSYQRLGGNSGRIRLEGYIEYSPVFCESGRGNYEQTLRMMQVPGPIRVVETACQCAGDAACVFDLSW